MLTTESINHQVDQKTLKELVQNLERSIVAGDVNKVKELFACETFTQQYVGVPAIDALQLGSCPLIHLIPKVKGGNRLAILDFLLEMGASIDTPDQDGKTLLHHAISRSNEPWVKILVKKGANPDWADKTGRTGLHKALDQENVEILEYLLPFTSSVIKPCNKSNVPIVMAAHYLKSHPKCKSILDFMLKQVYEKNGKPSGAIYEGALMQQMQSQPQIAVDEFCDLVNLIKEVGHVIGISAGIDVLKNVFVRPGSSRNIISANILLESLREYRPENKEAQEYFRQITEAFETFAHFLNKSEGFKTADLIKRFNDGKIVLVNCEFYSHTFSAVLFEDCIAIIDRSGNPLEREYCSVYKIPEENRKLINEDFFNKLKQVAKSSKPIIEAFGKIVDLNKPLVCIPAEVQKFSNCSLANIKTAIKVILFLLKLKQKKQEFLSGETAPKHESCTELTPYFRGKSMQSWILNPKDMKPFIFFAIEEYKPFTNFLKNRCLEKLVNAYSRSQTERTRSICLQLFILIAIEHPVRLKKVEKFYDKQKSINVFLRIEKMLNALAPDFLKLKRVVDALIVNSVNLIPIALELGKIKIIEMLSNPELNYFLFETIQKYIEQHNVKALQTLFSSEIIRKIALSQRDNEGKSLLHFAIKTGSLEMIHIFIEAGFKDFNYLVDERDRIRYAECLKEAASSCANGSHGSGGASGSSGTSKMGLI